MKQSENPTTELPTRRRFIQSTAVHATAAVAAPYIVPASVFGATAPSNRINVGCIGGGNQGFLDLKLFMDQPDCQLVAVCDVNRGSGGYKERSDVRGCEPARDLVEAFYSKRDDKVYKGCATYRDFRDVLGRDDIDAVVVVAPDHWHEQMTIAAAEAGKDVYCEKPLGLTIAGQQRMIKAVRDNGRVLQTGSHERSNPYVRDACELVRSGAIGDVGARCVPCRATQQGWARPRLEADART